MFSVLKRVARGLAVPAALISVLAAFHQAEAQQRVSERLPRAFPQLDTMAPQSLGADAVSRLGTKLPDVAAFYGKSTNQLRSQLLSDHNFRVDRAGRLFVVDELTTPLRATSTSTMLAPTGIVDGQLAPIDQTFKLHSRPGANLTIHLDFDGAKITGTAWNSSGNTLTAVPFDTDGNTASFSTSELQRIQYIWQRVAEDYAPFDVDVTTEAPSQDRITRSSSTDPIFGTTVVITKTTGVYSCSCGGVAYVGIFNMTSDNYKPALVFYDKLGPGDEKYVAEAISHEAGHNMGLSHDGVTGGSAYYSGQGTSTVTGWAPIMGVGYYQPLVQFSKGEYTGASNTEDDFKVMQTYGLALRADDFGSATTAATPFLATTTSGTVSGTLDGVIEGAGDSDVFAVVSGTGTFTASVAPSSRSPDVDLVLTLLDSSGQQLATNNLNNVLGASLTYNLPSQGTYYLQVNGTGQDDPATNGYSNYGSVGNYRLTASYPAPAGAPPVAVLSATPTTGIAPLAVLLNGGSSTDSDGTVKFWYWDFGDGTGSTAGTLKTTTKTYQYPGTYVVRLTVVDDMGLSGSTTQTITVNPSTTTTAKTVSVQGIQMTKKVTSSSSSATGTVTVVNQSGQLMSGATVAVTWSGLVSKSASGLTSSTGKVSFTSPSTTKKTGCFTLTVTKITLTGYTFSQSPLPSGKICIP